MSDIQFLGDTQRTSSLSSISAKQQQAEKQPEPPKAAASPFQGPVYFSPRIAIDVETANAVLQVRDTKTGDILRQYPPDSASQIYQSVQDTAASDIIPDAKIVEEAKDAAQGSQIVGGPAFGENEKTEPSFGAADNEKAEAGPPAPQPSAPSGGSASATPPPAGLSAANQASSGLTGQNKSDEQQQQQRFDTAV